MASKPSSATQAAAALADDRASLFDGYSYRERDAASILMEEDEPLSPVDRASGELMRSSFEQGNFSSNETRQSLDALTSEVGESPAPNNDSTSTINEDTASSDVPSTSTVDDSSEAISPSVSPGLPRPRLPSQQHHRQRSGIPALDRGLPSDIEAEEDEDDEDDDWDLVEKPRDGRGEHNGSRGTTLFARGVVDRYRLGVLKKKESRASGLSGSGMSTPRSVSAATLSTSNSSMTIGNDSSSSPSESRIRRGLTFKSSKFKVRPKTATSHSYATASKAPPTSQAPSSSSNPNSSASLSPSNMSASYSLPANLATNGHGGNRRSDHSAASSTLGSTPERSSSASPTKGLRVVSGGRSTGGEESDAGGTSSSRMSGQERMKMGKDKMMSLFGVKSSTSSSSSTSNQPPNNPSP